MPRKTDGHYPHHKNDTTPKPHHHHPTGPPFPILACADKPTQPELTEEDVASIVAKELAKIADPEKEEETALDWVTCTTS